MTRTFLISDEISTDLALRNTVNSLFSKIQQSGDDECIIDFSNIRSISRTFAHEYLTQKKSANKKISETNIPITVEKMFQIVKNSTDKPRLIEVDHSQVIPIND